MEAKNMYDFKKTVKDAPSVKGVSKYHHIKIECVHLSKLIWHYHLHKYQYSIQNITAIRKALATVITENHKLQLKTEVHTLLNSTSALWEHSATKQSPQIHQLSTLDQCGYPLQFPITVMHDLQQMYTLYIPDEDWLECLPRQTVGAVEAPLQIMPTLLDLILLTERILTVT
jgi:hypothetical protein